MAARFYVELNDVTSAHVGYIGDFSMLSRDGNGFKFLNPTAQLHSK